MKILIIGGTGTVGQAVASELQSRHEVIIAGSSSGDIQVDITDSQSIKQMYNAINSLDAVVLTTGKVHFDNFMAMEDEQYQVGLQNKLMGQVNVVLQGRHCVNDGGSFTLTSGILNHDPIRYGSSAAMVNGAIDGFVIAAALEMPKKQRINCISPTVLTESLDTYAEYFRGYESVSAEQVARAYSKSVEGLQTGKIYKVWF